MFCFEKLVTNQPSFRFPTFILIPGFEIYVILSQIHITAHSSAGQQILFGKNDVGIINLHKKLCMYMYVVLYICIVYCYSLNQCSVMETDSADFNNQQRVVSAKVKKDKLKIDS